MYLHFKMIKKQLEIASDLFSLVYLKHTDNTKQESKERNLLASNFPVDVVTSI